ncbi:MAG: LPS export ABC transporter permease LptF [Deltaproteobacteria bacterium]|nr:LPS export ABC transporter permease LptF [Deltaproteobacteria bacterium]
MKRIIPHYILREVLPNFFISLLVLTFILLLAKIPDLTELVVVKGVKARTILRFLWYSLPFLLSLTIPMSTLLAVLLAFLRLSGDNEITVLKSAGVSLYRLLPPVILFCLWTYLVTSYLLLYIVPSFNRSFRNELLALAKVSADISIKEGIFNNEFRKMVLYVDHIDLNEGWMREIFIQDGRDADVVNIINASYGRITTDNKQRTLVFELFNGMIDRVEESITFERYDLKLDMESALSAENLRPADQDEMDQDELWRSVDSLDKYDVRYYPYLLEAHKRNSLPFACLVLGLIGVPLGVQGRGRGRNWGISMGLGVFIGYYILFSAGLSFGESGTYPPILGMWVPNVVMGAVTLYMLRQTNREVPLRLVNLLDFFTSRLKSGERGSGA